MTGHITTAVVIPAHNARAYLANALESLRAQTVPPDEVVVADDGSSDSTADLAEGMGFRALRLPKSNGNVARNAGARATKGDLLFFLDADDWFLPGKIEAHLRAHAAGKWSLVIDPPTRITKEGRELGLSGPALGGPIEYGRFTSRTYWYGGSAASLRREAFEAVGGFREELTAQQDLDFWIRVAHARGPAFVSEGSHTRYLTNCSSLSRNPRNVIPNLHRVLEGLPFLTPAERRRFWCHVMCTTADNLPMPNSLPYLARALSRPWDPRLAKALLRSVAKTLRR